jgi:hypothetical protein
MKVKIFLFGILLVSVFCFTSTVLAMTDSEKQALIQSLTQQILQLQTQLVQLQAQNAGQSNSNATETVSCHDFNYNLGINNSGQEVSMLHKILQKEGFLINSSEASAQTYSNSTIAAVKSFQEKYASEILNPNGLVRGTGYFGNSTRVKLNALYGCSKKQTSEPSLSCTPNWQTVTPYRWICVNGYSSDHEDLNKCGVPYDTTKQPCLTIIYPFGNETWTPGKTYEIKWDTAGRTSDEEVSINFLINYYLIQQNTYSLPGATDFNGAISVATHIPATQGKYTWTFPTLASQLPYAPTLLLPSGHWYYAGTNWYRRSLSVVISLFNKGSEHVKATTDSNSNFIDIGKYESSCSDEWQWNCGEWSHDCINKQQTRTCTPVNACSQIYAPTVRSCTPTPENCTPKWQTGQWGTCTNSQQTRTVADINGCGVTTNKPTTTQSCTVTCSSDSSCGTNTYTGSPFCKTVTGTAYQYIYQNYVTYKCNNPGKTDSYCSSSTSEQSKTFCYPQACENGQCVTKVCNVNSDCGTNYYSQNYCKEAGTYLYDVYKNYITFACGNPGVTNECKSDIVPQLVKHCLFGQGCSNGACTGSCIPSWQCTDWSPYTCTGTQTQTRTCTDSNNCGTDTDKPKLSQSCCTPSWGCTAWTECYNGSQARGCSDANNCGVTTNMPPIVQACRMQCRDDETWTCTDWSACSNGIRTRTCTTPNNCYSYLGQPATTQACVSNAWVNLKINNIDDTTIKIGSLRGFSLFVYSKDIVSCTKTATYDPYNQWSGTLSLTNNFKLVNILTPTNGWPKGVGVFWYTLTNCLDTQGNILPDVKVRVIVNN